MPYIIRRYFLFVCAFLGISFLAECQSQTQGNQVTQQPQVTRQKQRDRVYQRHDEQRTQTYRSNKASNKDTESRARSVQVPQKVYDVLTYVLTNHQPMAGYVGGRRFGNFENHLPRSDTDGKPIRYQEWDVNPKIQGRNRGTQRLVTGSDGRAWYTNDHYNTFTEVK